MVNLHEDVSELFSLLSVPEVYGHGRPVRSLFRYDDCHPAAEQWISATDDERAQLRLAHDRELAELSRRNSEAMRRRPKPPRVRDKEKERQRLREYRKRVKTTARWSSMTNEQRERQRGYTRAWRARKQDSTGC